MKQALILLASLPLIFNSLPELRGATGSIALSADYRAQNAISLDGPERGAVALDQALRGLTNPFTVMAVAAHPDDVDGGALAYYRKKLGARAAIVLATRGEERPCSTDSETDEAPGVACAREALKSARAVGADLYFLNLPDFGESKSIEETFSEWGYKKALGNLVRAIRLIRPDVIITDHDSETGGGQHQAVGRLLLDAFEAAADAKQFAEAGQQVWQVRRIFRRAVTGSLGVIINLGEYDHLRGLTYAQIARAAGYSAPGETQRSDLSQPVNERVHYELVRSNSDEKGVYGGTFFDGLILPESLARALAPPRLNNMALTEAIAMRGRLIEGLKEKLFEKRAEGSVKEMIDRYGAEFLRMVRFIESLERALALALGVSFEIAISDRTLIPGQKFTARLTFHNGSSSLLPFAFHWPESLPKSEEKPSFVVSEVIQSAAGQTIIKEIRYEIPKDAPLTLPHAERLSEETYYPVASALPEAQSIEPAGNRFIALAEIGLGHTTIPLPAQARYDVAPPVELSTIPYAFVKDWDSPREIEFPARLRNRTPGPLAGALWVVPMAITVDDYEPVHLRFTNEDQQIPVKLKLKLPILRPPLSSDILIEFRRERPAPPDPLASWKVEVRAAEMEIAEGLQVGYIRGFDSSLEFALTAMGVKSFEIDPREIKGFEHGHTDAGATETGSACAKLSRYDAIIIDEQAYTARPELASISECLLEYARRGGNLITLYQKPDEWRPAETVAPFPIKLSNNHVTVEAAPVKFIKQDHPLLQKPNQISEGDFEGWAKRRARYLPEEWADEYTPLLESSDPGEEPQKGGLLVARYGEGFFVYVSYDLRTQLSAGNAGAYRLMANLISLSKTMKQQATEQK